MRPEDQDPYAPPPRYKMRSGAVMRFIILAALLGGAAWAYVSFSGQQQTASLTPPAQEEQLADSGYQVNPAPGEAAPAAPAPEATPAPAQTPARTTSPPARSSSSSSGADQNVPPPSTSIGSTPG